jgi:hypothetical protein
MGLVADNPAPPGMLSWQIERCLTRIATSLFFAADVLVMGPIPNEVQSLGCIHAVAILNSTGISG